MRWKYYEASSKTIILWLSDDSERIVIMSNENKKRHMAHNIYSNPILTRTSKKFDGFSIDFRGVQTPISTYWALCNWEMDISSFKNEHPDALGGGAYSGMQNTINGKTAILSFWEILYENETKRHRASRVYPEGKESSFGGEGEGTNYIVPFEWKDMTWYRMVLRSWRDAETGKTFVGQWIENRESGEWTLVSYFNTGLDNSFLKGGMSQFQENFWDEHSEYIREFNLKNIYVKDISDGEWKYVERTSLSYDDPKWGFNTAGTHNFGATQEYFYASAGSDVDDQKKYDTQRPLSSVYGIERSEEFVTYGSCDIILERKDGKKYIKIVEQAHKAPVLCVKTELMDEKGNVISVSEITRPHLKEYTLAESVSVKVTTVDIFGRTNERIFSA